MLQRLNLQADYPVLPPLSVQPVAAELDRRDFEGHLADLHTRLHRERRAQFYRNLSNLWPIALGIAMSCCATSLRDAVAGYAPILAKFLFPLSVLAAFHDTHLGPDAMPTLSQVMLYAQFFVDGLVACILLRQRSHWLTVCAQIALFHGLFLLSIGWVAGSFRAVTMN